MSTPRAPVERKRQLQADLALLAVTAVWGATFVMVKDATAGYPVFPFLAIRFGLGMAALLLVGGRRLRTLDRSSFRVGLLAGLFLLGGYAFQTLGLQHTTASKAGFITGLSVVLVPLIAALVVRERPQPPAVVAVVLATAGLGVLTLNQTLAVGQGDLLVLAGAFCFALHIVTLSIGSPRGDPIALTILQLAVVTTVCTGLSLASTGVWPAPAVPVWRAAVFTGILATAVAFGVQTAAQRLTTATHTALIFTAEPVFAGAFGVLVAGEPLTSRLATGGLMILGGALISEVVWSDRTARLVSRFLAPHYVLGLCWLLLALMGSGTWREGIRWTGLIIVPCMLALLAVFGLALRRGTISDWHISSRQERMAPLLIGPSIVLSALPAVLFYRMDAPPVLLAAALATFALVLVNLAITSFWKISQHASSVALGTTLLAASLGAGAAPALLLIPLVGWARVKLGAHTVGQTVAGCVTGALIPVVALRLLGVG